MKTTAALLVAAACVIALVRGDAKASPHTSARNSTLTLVRGVRVGHHTLTERPTGCTVVLVDGGAIAGVAQQGAAPGTRETDMLRSTGGTNRIDAIALSGGSAYGLSVASGVVRWIEERKGREGSKGRKGTHAPIVPAGVLIDLWVGNRPDVRPDADCGYRASAAASSSPVAEGTIGAGAGATVGKLAGVGRAMKGGIGTAAVELPSGLQVAALVAVNALGDVVDPRSGEIVAGTRAPDGSLADARTLLRHGLAQPRAGENTTIGVIATNAALTNADAHRLARMADDGYARTIVPIHTQADGDTVFAVATGRWRGAVDPTALGALAADVMADAIVRAATQATAAAGTPAARDMKR
jgi:L-aminopeptidase/D-esterase-like protein